MNTTDKDTPAQIVARKLETASIQQRKFEGTTYPANKGDNRSTLEVLWEGRKFRVTVQDMGPEED